MISSLLHLKASGLQHLLSSARGKNIMDVWRLSTLIKRTLLFVACEIMFNFLNLILYFWHRKQGNMHHLFTVLGSFNQNLLVCASFFQSSYSRVPAFHNFIVYATKVAQRCFFWLNCSSPISRQLLLGNTFLLWDLSHSRGLCNFRTWHFLSGASKRWLCFANFNRRRMQMSLAGRNPAWVYNPKGRGDCVCGVSVGVIQVVGSRKSAAWSLGS